MTIIYEGYETNKNGRPINSQGKIIKTNNKGQIIFNQKGNPVLRNSNNFQLPKRIPQDSSKNIKQHEKTNYSYRIIKIENKNGAIIEKYVKVGKDGRNIKDGEKYIYLHKETGEPISGNGKKYKVNKLTKELLKTKNSNGYILENNEEINNFLPKRMASLSIIPQQTPPPGMMRVSQGIPPGGFKGSIIKNQPQYIPQQTTSTSGSFFNYKENAQKSNQVPTVFGPSITPKKTGFRS
jgi:hypothetical protein